MQVFHPVDWASGRKLRRDSERGGREIDFTQGEREGGNFTLTWKTGGALRRLRRAISECSPLPLFSRISIVRFSPG